MSLTRNRLQSLLLLLLGLSLCSANIPFVWADIPAAALKTPPMVKEQSVSTYIPSEAAPGQGLAVNMIYSTRPRYKEGAPVAVVVPGGNHSHGLDSSIHLAQQGFVELRFAFPGGGKPGFASSGIYDNRGIKSQEALRDVLRFAAGEIEDYSGKKISDLVPVTVYNKSVGAIGWSNGGNVLIVTLTKFASELPFVSWISFYESPIGSLFFPPNLGGAEDRMLNKHYRQGTAATGQPLVDWSKLNYEKTGAKNPGSHKKLGEAEFKGVVYFDENKNGAWEESTEYALTYAADLGFDKAIYPPQATKVLVKLPDYAPPKPEKIEKGDKAKAKESKPAEPEKPVLPLPFASFEESHAYFRDRDGSLHVKKLVELFPQMAFCLFGSHLDHLQRQPDHPHIAMLYNSLLEAKAKFLRLNPSSYYVAQVSGMKASTFPENRPMVSLESDAIDQYLEPEGLIPDYSYMEASAAELSDRVYLSKWTKSLVAPLVEYSNGAKLPEEASSATKGAAGKKLNTQTPAASSGSEKTPTSSTNPANKTKEPPKRSSAPVSGPGGFVWPTAETDSKAPKSKKH